MATRDIGIDVQPPQGSCEDPYCPFHGALAVRGQQLVGTVVSTRMDRSVVVQREYLKRVPKYQRFEKRTSRYTAHAPPCWDVSVGDEVTLMECRPLSKTKTFVVVEARKGELPITGEDYTEAEGLEPVAETPEAAEEPEEEEVIEE